MEEHDVRMGIPRLRGRSERAAFEPGQGIKEDTGHAKCHFILSLRFAARWRDRLRPKGQTRRALVCASVVVRAGCLGRSAGRLWFAAGPAGRRRAAGPGATANEITDHWP